MVGALALNVTALVAADSAPNFLLLLLHDHAMCLCIQGIMLALHAAVHCSKRRPSLSSGDALMGCGVHRCTVV